MRILCESGVCTAYIYLSEYKPDYQKFSVYCIRQTYARLHEPCFAGVGLEFIKPEGRKSHIAKRGRDHMIPKSRGNLDHAEMTYFLGE